MNFLAKALFFVVCLTFLVYQVLPSPKFPNPPPDSVQSQEEGDNETPLRRAYFTNFTREEVLEFYQSQFGGYRLNYPPEESQTLIRDQTRSTFLEEIVHPLRETLFVNGFEPKNPQDEIWYKGVHYRQKIIIRYYPSNVLVRVIVSLATLVSTIVLLREWVLTIRNSKFEL